MNPVPPDAVMLKADIKPIAEIPRHYRMLPRAQRSDISVRMRNRRNPRGIATLQGRRTASMTTAVIWLIDYNGIAALQVEAHSQARQNDALPLYWCDCVDGAHPRD